MDKEETLLRNRMHKLSTQKKTREQALHKQEQDRGHKVSMTASAFESGCRVEMIHLSTKLYSICQQCLLEHYSKERQKRCLLP